MDWIGPTDAAYDERRALFNAMIDKRPRLIAACKTPADIRAALDRARQDGLAVAVRSAGHSVAGQSTNDDGLVIDVRDMTDIDIDPAARTARVGGGCTWADFDAAAQQHGLATTGGRVSTTGVAGLTLGGGSGWLERKHGLACDNLLAVELVTADGREIRADDTQHQDLLWASKGGGGNFGVVTALEFALHPVGPIILGGLMAWPADAADQVARAYRDWADDAPDELGSGLVMLSGPPEEFIPAHLQNQPMVAIAVMWSGDEAEGTALVQVMRDLEPDLDLVGPMPYAQLQSMIDDPPGFRQYWSADYHDAFPDQALDAVPRRRPEPHLTPDPAPAAALGRSAEPDRGGRHPDGTARRPLGDPPVRHVDRPRRRRAQHRLGPGLPSSERAVHHRRRLPQLHRRRGRGTHQRRVRYAKLDRLAAIKAEYDPATSSPATRTSGPRFPPERPDPHPHRSTEEHVMTDKQNIDTPHERRPFKDHGHMDVVTLADFTLGRGVFEPGWRWSNDVKPIAGTDSCQTHHTGICLSGQMTVRLRRRRGDHHRPRRRHRPRPRTRRLDRRRRALRPVWTPASRRTPSPAEPGRKGRVIPPEYVRQC